MGSRNSSAAVADETVPVSIRFPKSSLQEIGDLAREEGDNAASWIRRQAIRALHETKRGGRRRK